MSTTLATAPAVAKDEHGRLVIPEEGNRLSEIKRLIDRYFAIIPLAVRYDRVVVENPSGADPEKCFFIGLRPVTVLGDATQCGLPAYRCFQQILDTARTRLNYKLEKMSLIVPYGRPADLIIHMHTEG